MAGEQEEYDNELAGAARRGDSTALDRLIKKYTPMVRKIISGYNLPGNEREDLLQEGLIGLYGAVLAFDETQSKGQGQESAAGFAFFAKLCVTRRINTAAKAAVRGKHAPLSAYEPISPHIKDREQTPEEAFLDKEALEALSERINAKLSAAEKRALSLRLAGMTSDEIAARMGCSRRSVDNALFRARRKLC